MPEVTGELGNTPGSPSTCSQWTLMPGVVTLYSNNGTTATTYGPWLTSTSSTTMTVDFAQGGLIMRSPLPRHGRHVCGPCDAGLPMSCTCEPIDLERRENPIAVARRRARDLLFRFLDDEQQRNYVLHGEFDFIGSDGLRYQIHNRSYTGNVTVFDTMGNRLGRYCAHPSPRDRDGRTMPIEDILLTQMLLLKTDADEFYRVANRH